VAEVNVGVPTDSRLLLLTRADLAQTGGLWTTDGQPSAGSAQCEHVQRFGDDRRPGSSARAP